MKNRIKEVRSKLGEHGKTQEEFAAYLGISKSNLASYESGRRTPSESVIRLICARCNVNEEWLRTGNGTMFPERTRNQELASFRKRFLSALSKLNEDDWKTLQKIAEELTKEG